MVLAAPLLTGPSMRLDLEEPDHIGTAAFILLSFLLIERVPARPFTAPLVCVILCLGQASDLTVRYVALPAIVGVCGWRALAARRLRSPDAALVLAAAGSVPLESLLRLAMTRLGAFVIVAPRTRFAPPGQWAHHVPVLWYNLRYLFGAIDPSGAKQGVLDAGFGFGCLLAAALGIARVVWAWRRAIRAEQLLCVAIACNLGVYLLWTQAGLGSTHEIVVVLPCAAVLAARALVPARIASAPVALAAVGAAALAAVLPLVAAATVPLDKPVTASLTRWLEAHHLRYGVAGYWDGAAATLQSGDRVQIRPVNIGKTLYRPSYEDNGSWYDPSLHDATFAVAAPGKYPPADFERTFGKPAVTYDVGGWIVMVYRENLLKKVLR